MLSDMRLLGIDYGSKKVGLSLTDESGTMAFPHEGVKNDIDLLKKLVSLCEEKGVEEIVIGHSINISGEDNKLQTAINELVTDLTLELGLPIHLEPEQYTSKAAERIQGRNEKLDASAAAIILDGYLQKNKNT